MAISPQDRARAKELAKELVKMTGGRFNADGSSKTFYELEIQTNLIGDFVTSMAINQAAEEMPEEEKCVRCPKCKAVPRKYDPDDDEPMVITAARGDVEWVTQGYYCRRCRRSFFPDAR